MTTKRRKLQSLLRAISFATFSMMSTQTKAIVPIAYKGVSKHFKPGKKHFDPTRGALMAKSALTENIRFYGNFKEAYDGEQHRNYQDDKSDDPMWNLEKILFPSVTGQLGIETNSNSNFAKRVSTPQVLSEVLNSINDIRTIGNKTKEAQALLLQKQQQRFYNLVHLMATNEELKHIEAIDAAIREFSAKHMDLIRAILNLIRDDNSLSEQIKDASPEEKKNVLAQKKNLSKERQDLTRKLSLALSDQLKHLVVNDKTRKASADLAIKSMNQLLTDNDDFMSGLQALLANAFINADGSGTSTTSQNVNQVLNILSKAIDSEGAFYPVHFTEELILRFFHEKFNDQAQIWELLANLDESIVYNRNEVPYPEKEDLLKFEDIYPILQKEFPELDDIYDLIYAKNLIFRMPFESGGRLISNGKTYCYQRTTNQVTEDDFQDCAETSIRQILSMLLMNIEKAAYDFTDLDKHMANRQNNNPVVEGKNNIYENLKEFFTAYGPNKANDGHTETRSAFNRVVADLNAVKFQKDIPIVYKRNNQNEIEARLENIIAVFQKILKLDLTPMPRGSGDKSALNRWVHDSFMTILRTINPNHSYEIQTEVVTHENHAVGTVKIIANKGKDNEFRFDLNSSLKHAYIDEFYDALQTNKKAQSYEDAIHALSQKVGHDFDLVKSATGALDLVSNPLFSLLSTPLNDNQNKIDLLEKIFKLPALLKQEIYPHIKPILIHTIESVAWDDQHTFYAGSKILGDLLNDDILKDDVMHTFFPLVKSKDQISFVVQNIQSVDKDTPLYHLALDAMKRIFSQDPHSSLIDYVKHIPADSKNDFLPDIYKILKASVNDGMFYFETDAIDAIGLLYADEAYKHDVITEIVPYFTNAKKIIETKLKSCDPKSQKYKDFITADALRVRKDNMAFRHYGILEDIADQVLNLTPETIFDYAPLFLEKILSIKFPKYDEETKKMSLNLLKDKFFNGATEERKNRSKKLFDLIPVEESKEGEESLKLLLLKMKTEINFTDYFVTTNDIKSFLKNIFKKEIYQDDVLTILAKMHDTDALFELLSSIPHQNWTADQRALFHEHIESFNLSSSYQLNSIASTLKEWLLDSELKKAILSKEYSEFTIDYLEPEALQVGKEIFPNVLQLKIRRGDYEPNISDLSEFKNLEFLEITNVAGMTFDLKECTQLKMIKIENSAVKFNGLGESIECVYLKKNYGSNLLEDGDRKPINLPNIKELILEDLTIPHLNLKDFTKLESLELKGAYIKTMEFGDCIPEIKDKGVISELTFKEKLKSLENINSLANQKLVNVIFEAETSVSVLNSLRNQLYDTTFFIQSRFNSDAPFQKTNAVVFMPNSMIRLEGLTGFDAVNSLQFKNVDFDEVTTLDLLNSKWGPRINANYSRVPLMDEISLKNFTRVREQLIRTGQYRNPEDLE